MSTRECPAVAFAGQVAVLRDSNDLEFLIACADDIPNGFANEKPCHRGYEGDAQSRTPFSPGAIFGKEVDRLILAPSGSD
jgi:hypothetical protein